MEERIIYETNNLMVYVPKKPHISREEGAHLCIACKDDSINSRLDLSPKLAKEFIRLSMLVGQAMLNALRKRGIKIERINYQENGNWSFLVNEIPFFHLHLYGRVKNSKHQKFGEALYFPDPKSSYYDNLVPLNTDDIKAIVEELEILENTEKYSLESWL